MLKARKKPVKKRKPAQPRKRFSVDVGKRLADGREAAGLSQVVLAGKLGVSAQRLANWENGANTFAPQYAAKLFLATRIDADWLYRGDPNKLPADIFNALFNPESGAA